jgi:phospholipid/cholesterol/gamma-HCH transport system permease protein
VASTVAILKVGERVPQWVRRLPQPLAEIGEMTELLCRVIWSAVRHPIGYWGDVRDLMLETLQRCWLACVISTTALCFSGPGLQGGGLYSLLGIPERLGSFLLMAAIREIAPWIVGMVIAGVMGTAMAADLGARRIREEFDALMVLGVDPVRSLVLPRIIAVSLMTGLFVLPGLIFGMLGGYFAAGPVFGANGAAYAGNFWSNATTVDMWGAVVKTLVYGLILSTVCCYKGMKAEGGPIGVGRSVNQAVVIAFVGIWIFNYVYTNILLGLNPQMHVFK